MCSKVIKMFTWSRQRNNYSPSHTGLDIIGKSFCTSFNMLWATECVHHFRYDLHILWFTTFFLYHSIWWSLWFCFRFTNALNARRLTHPRMISIHHHLGIGAVGLLDWFLVMHDPFWEWRRREWRLQYLGRLTECTQISA